MLLWAGIGDTIRVSLSADPVEEVKVGFDILKSLGLRHRGVNIISCPSCARQEFNVIETVEALEERLAHITTPMTLSIIGCVVNGPGEARETDIGFTGGGNGTHQVYLSGDRRPPAEGRRHRRPPRRAGREEGRRDRGGEAGRGSRGARRCAIACIGLSDAAHRRGRATSWKPLPRSLAGSCGITSRIPPVRTGRDEHRADGAGRVRGPATLRAAHRFHAGAGRPAAAELAVVIPTLNERDNVPVVVERLNRVARRHLLGGRSSSTTIRPTGPPMSCARCRGASPISASCSGSAGAVWHRPASTASWPARRPMSPSWMATCSTTRTCCRRCSPRSRPSASTSSSPAATSRRAASAKWSARAS